MTAVMDDAKVKSCLTRLGGIFNQLSTSQHSYVHNRGDLLQGIELDADKAEALVSAFSIAAGETDLSGIAAEGAVYSKLQTAGLPDGVSYNVKEFLKCERSGGKNANPGMWPKP